MSNLCFQIIPALQTLKIIGDTDGFKNWMQQKHPDKKINDVFEGYRFSLSCCLNSFVDGISSDCELGIENGFLLNRAISQLKPIHLLLTACEKTVFLKNIKSIVKAIVKSQNYVEISQALNLFNNSITFKFDTIFSNCISVSSEISLSKR